MIKGITEILELRSKLEKMSEEELLAMGDILGYEVLEEGMEKSLLIELFLEEKKKEKGKEREVEELKEQTGEFPVLEEKTLTKKEKKQRIKEEKKVIQELKKKEKQRKRGESIGRKIYRPIFLWGLFLCAFVFAIYKNFTGIDKHTIHEKEVVKEVLSSSRHIENFALDFFKVYFTFDNKGEAREKDLEKYVSHRLLDYSEEMGRVKQGVSSTLLFQRIWKVEKAGDGIYLVTAEVELERKEAGEGEEKPEKIVKEHSFYTVRVYEGKKGEMKIVELPYITELKLFSKKEFKKEVGAVTVEDKTKKEIGKFLEDFFKVYPSLERRDLKYYAEDGTMDKIGNKALEFESFPELIIKKASKDKVEVLVFVTYKRTDVEMVQTFEYDLVLRKKDNWKIEEKR